MAVIVRGSIDTTYHGGGEVVKAFAARLHQEKRLDLATPGEVGESRHGLTCPDKH